MGRRIATLYLPIDVPAFAKIATAIDEEFPGSIAVLDPTDPEILHIEEATASVGEPE